MKNYKVALLIVGVILIIISLIFTIKINEKFKTIIFPPQIPTNGTIPYVLYQTTRDKNKITNETQERIKSWGKLNPGIEHHIYNDIECRKFIKENFDLRVLKAYDKLIPGAFKADLWRYCILYKKGGNLR